MLKGNIKALFFLDVWFAFSFETSLIQICFLSNVLLTVSFVTLHFLTMQARDGQNVKMNR